MMIKKVGFTLIALCIAFALPAQFKQALKKANKEYELHAFNLAIESYKDALRKRPDNAEALGKLADCYRHLNQMEEAAKWYVQALKQKDYNKADLFNYGKVLKTLGQYEEARKQFLKYARDFPNEGDHFAKSCVFAQQQLTTTSAYSVNIEFINTSASEFGPTFYGQQVVYSSARNDIQRSSSNWTGKSNNQLFVANIGSSGYLESPLFLRNSQRNEFNQGPVAFSPDGTIVVFTKNNFVDGTRQIPSSGMELSLHIATVNQNGDWGNSIPFPYNGSNYSSGFPSFSPDGQMLFFASDRPDGFGGYDIYMSRRMGNTWGTPENLGPKVNSPGNEITPYIMGDQLYFASDFHFGLGGFDVFRAEQTNGRWIQIYHLGNGVNSPSDDYGFIYDEFRNVGYMTSNRNGGRGNEDIYKVSKSADNVIVRVINASDGTPIPNAIIDFSNCNEGIFATNANGLYSFQAVQGLNCNIMVRKEGFQDGALLITAQGLQRNREYEIGLNRLGEDYPGQVLNYTSRLPAQGVTVIATNTTTGAQTSSLTDQNGYYTLGLSKNSIYVLRFTGPGYKDSNITVQTTDGFDRSILGVISLLPSSAVGGGGIQPPIDLGGPVTPRNPGDVVISSGFSIQVAALSKPDLQSFDELSNYGQLYYKKVGSTYKIRVGVYDNRMEAENALRLVKSQGYRQAFLVAEEGTSTAKSGTINAGQPSGITAQPPVSSFGRYKVQLAAYRDTRWFDETLVRDLGVIEERFKGELTVKYVGGFDTIGEAQSALRKAKSAGFNTAFIVEQDANGNLNKVK